MLQSLLALDASLLISARSLVGSEYAILIQILGESVVIFGALFLIALWLIGVKKKNDEYKKNALRIFFTIISVFVIYSILNLGIPQWRESPISIAGGIAPLIPHPIDNSFPSGHALFSAALIYGIWRYFRNKWILLITILLALITTASRVIGGVHYPGDILGGLFFGGFGACIVAPVVTSQFLEKYLYPMCIRIARFIKL